MEPNNGLLYRAITRRSNEQNRNICPGPIATGQMFALCSFDLLVIVPRRRAPIALYHSGLKTAPSEIRKRTDLGGVSEYLGEGRSAAARTAEERRIARRGARAGSRRRAVAHPFHAGLG